MRCTLDSYSAVGRRRNNEDACLAVRRGEGMLALVADGLGGYAFGERASREAVRALERETEDAVPSASALDRAIGRADAAVRKLQREFPGAMTTIAALWFDGDTAYAGHVGDTRIYQLRSGAIVYQSEDHSLAQLAVKDGEIGPEDIRGYPERNVLFRALGGRGETRPELRELPVMPGDRFLLCSDGFWERVTEEELLRSAAHTAGAEAWLAELRSLAEPAADDNNTAVAVVFERERGEREP